MKKIVAAEADKRGLCLYFHEGGSFRTEILSFAPFVLLSDDAPALDNCRIETLDGEGFFRRQAFFNSFEDYENTSAELKKAPGVMFFRDTLQQALSILDLRLFEEVDFSELRQMYFIIHSADGKTISAIETADNNGATAVFEGGEKSIIEKFNSRIKEFDPDLLAGFNCCRNDLPLLIKRAEKHKITLDCGRNGGTFSCRQSRYSAGEKQYSYQRFTLPGRHIADMLHPVQFFDAIHRDLEDFELPTLQEYFNIRAENAAVLIGRLSEILLPAYFYRTRELPLGFQECLLRGSGSALDALLIAEYLKRKRAIPLPEASRSYAGALSTMENSGVFQNVRHCDVRSLYPSLLLHFKQSPRRDEAGIFLELLEKLRSFRLAAKDRAKILPDSKEKQQLNALQNSFKILINSFYGYLGYAQGTFNDYALAEKITAAGRELLGKLVQTLQQHGATVIEMDTDGIYFQSSPENDSALNDVLQQILPSGIDLEFDAEYPAMYSYKAKNYALLAADGTIKLTGAALKSRALEPFQRKFIMEVVKGKLHGDPLASRKAYARWQEALTNRTIPLEDLAKSEVLSDSPENYKRKLAAGSTRRSAAYELALASGKNFRAGDKVKFYVTGNKAKLPVVGNSCLLENAPEVRDENTAYYLAKLDILAETFC